MPRDPNGVYSLPSGTLVSTGQTIQVSQHNPFANDIADAMSQSLARNGLGAMQADLDMGGFGIVNLVSLTAPTINVDANFGLSLAIGNPRVTFDTDDFMAYDRTANTFDVVIGGTGRFAVTASGASVAGSMAATGGFTLDAQAAFGLNSGNVRLAFDANDYMAYDRTANTLDVVIGGVGRFAVTASGVSVSGNVTASGAITATGGTLTGQSLVGVGIGGGSVIDPTCQISDLGTFNVLSPGFRGCPVGTFGATRNLEITDGGKALVMTGGGGAGSFGIFADASVNHPIGTTVVLANVSGSNCPINIGPGVTLVWVGTTLTGARNLSSFGMATVLKFAPNQWLISGAGLS